MLQTQSVHLTKSSSLTSVVPAVSTNGAMTVLGTSVDQFQSSGVDVEQQLEQGTGIHSASSVPLIATGDVTALQQILAVAADHQAADRRLLRCGVAMILSTLLSLIVGRSFHAQVRSESCHTKAMQATVCIYMFLIFVTFTAVIPEAHDLSQKLGFAPVESGWLIGSCWPMVGLSSLATSCMTRDWEESSRAKIFPVAVTLMPLLLLVSAIVVEPPTFLGYLSNELRFNTVIASRVMVGLIDGTAFLQCSLVISILPPAQLATFNVFFVCIKTVAMGMGPFVSGLICSIAGSLANVDGALARYSLVEYWLAILWAIYACFNWWVVIRVMPETPAGSAENDSRDRQLVKQESSAYHEDLEVSQLPDSSRKNIWVAGVFYGVERAFVVSAMQSAVSMILETEVHWRTTVIGMAVGASVIATLPVTGTVWILQGYYKFSQLKLMRICAICVVVSCPIFFPQISTGGYPTTPYIMLLGLGIMFGAGYMANSIASSLAMRCALPGTCYTVENLLILDSIVEDSIARLVAPAFARYILEHYGQLHGRTIYATSQMIFCIIGFTSLWSAAQKWPSDNDTKKLMKKTMTDTQSCDRTLESVND